MTQTHEFKLGGQSLKVRNARGDNLTLPPRLWLYVWSGRNGCLQDMRDSVNETQRIAPDALIVHGSPSEIRHDGAAALRLAAETMGSIHRDPEPFGRVGLGIGGDGWAGDWRYGRATAQQVIAPMVDAVRVGYALGVRFFVPNLEAAWKDDNGGADIRSLADIEALAAQLAAALCAAAPEGVFALSSYDLPKYHASMRAVIRPLSRAFALSTGQTYVAETGVPRRGMLPGRVDAFYREVQASAARGWREGDVVGPEDLYTDCDAFPTVQGHKTAPGDLARVLIEQNHVAVWSAPSIVDAGRREDGRLDEQGIRALCFAMLARSQGFIGPGAVAAFQEALGVAADGQPGPATFAAAGVEWLGF